MRVSLTDPNADRKAPLRVVLSLWCLVVPLFSYGLALPLEGTDLPTGLLSLLGSLSLLGLIDLAVREERDTRFCSIAAGLSVLHLLVISAAWSSPDAVVVASRLAKTLSRTNLQMPLVGVLHGWAMLCLGLVVSRSMKRLLDSTRLRSASIFLAYVAGAGTAALGVRAVIGYATGNLSLLPT